MSKRTAPAGPVTEGTIVDIPASKHLSDSFVRYALMVTRQRAIPDARDGFKPVQRRIIWSTLLTAADEFQKCAKIVGDCMGKFHPHGESTIYDALVGLATDFDMRLPLIKPQGNFGSPGGDGAAASRYTEAKLAEVSREEIVKDWDKETVRFRDNYDGREREPEVLPVSFPQLLVNGSDGIAVGMSESIPPHNLVEVCDAARLLIDDPDATVDQIMRKIKGPDLPGGGIIVADENFRATYAIGKGYYRLQARVEKREGSHGRTELVATELVHGVTRPDAIKRIVELVQDGTIEGIADIRDEADKHGEQLVFELKKDADADRVLRLLYANSLLLRKRMNVDMIVLAEGGVPTTMGVKKLLQYWIEFRTGVIRNRSTFELKRLKAREHILEGFIKALDSIDKVIKTIRETKGSRNDAKERLKQVFDFSEAQAEEIVAMPLGRLANLEQVRIREELAQVRKDIAYHQGVLKDREKVKDIMREDLERVRTKYGTPRRTTILSADDAGEMLSTEDVVPDEEVVLTVNRKGFAKRYKAETLAKRTGERDAQDDLVTVGTSNARDEVYMFTAQGRAYRFKAARFPEARATERGQALEALVQMEKNDAPVAILPVTAAQYVFFTKAGEVKRVEADDFKNANAGGIAALTLADKDTVVAVSPCTDRSQLLVQTRSGLALRFKAAEVRLSGRGSGTVRAITLKQKGDEIVGAGAGGDKAFLVTVVDEGFAKKTRFKDIPLQGRSTTGVRAINFGQRAKAVTAALVVEEGDRVLLRTKADADPRVVKLDEVIEQPRDRAGQRLLAACAEGVLWTGQERIRESA